jgi:AcrR family transcriptional regulator
MKTHDGGDAMGSQEKPDDRPPRLRGRPRSDEAERTILKVTRELLASRGFVALNYDELSARAHCSKATVYRRWSSKGRLAVAALAELPDPPLTQDRGDLRVELLELLEGMIAIFDGSPAITIMQSLIGERARNPELADLLDAAAKTRRLGLAKVLQRGVDRGELSAQTDIELAMDLIAGPILCRYLFTGARVERDFLEDLVEKVLAGFAS